MNDRIYPGATDQSFLKKNSVLDIIETTEIRKLSDISRLPSEQPDQSINKNINSLGSSVLTTLQDQGINVQRIGATAIAKAESGIKQMTGEDVDLNNIVSGTNLKGALAGSLLGGASLSAANIVAGAAIGSMIDKDPLIENTNSAYPRHPARQSIGNARPSDQTNSIQQYAKKESFTRFLDKRINRGGYMSRNMIVQTKPTNIVDVVESFVSNNSFAPYSSNSILEKIDNAANKFKRKITGHNKFPKNSVEKFTTDNWNCLALTLIIIILASFILMLAHILYKSVLYMHSLKENTSTKAIVDNTLSPQPGGCINSDIQILKDNIFQSQAKPCKLEGSSTTKYFPVNLSPCLEKQYTASDCIGSICEATAEDNIPDNGIDAEASDGNVVEANAYSGEVF